jgi:hypothetical protein
MIVLIERSNGFHRIIEKQCFETADTQQALKMAESYCESICNILVKAECLSEDD